MKLNAQVIAEAVQGQLLGEDCLLDGVSIDTRTLQAGNLYIAIAGQRFDGHDFVAQAEQAGAAALVVSRICNSSLPQILVEDSHLALAELAGFWRDNLNLHVAGVTGSNGKTTVKEMIAAIFATQGATLATKGNLNNDIGVPLTLLQLKDSHRYAVIEMGANHPGEIAYTSRYAKANVSVINNVGAAHLEGFRSIDGVAAAKGEIVASLAADGVAVLNRDDEFYFYWCRVANERRIVSFGFNDDADIRASNIVSRLEQGRFITGFQCHVGNQSQAFELNLAGQHNVKNALAATAVALQFGIALNDIASALRGLQPVTGRMQALAGRNGNVVVDDTYNANPSSLQAALDALTICDAPVWLALGAFGELGDNSPELHRQMGAMIKQKGIARLFATGDHARHSIEAFGAGGEFFDSQDDLIRALSNALSGKEVLLIKGSRAQKMENVAAALVDNFRA